MSNNKDDREANDDELYVCPHCGKTSKDIFGKDSTQGWDESCAINCNLYKKSDLIFNGDRVVKITGKPVEN